MSGAPRILKALSDADFLLAIRFGVTVMPKSELRNRFKAFKPQGGVRIPKPDRDAPEKVAHFLARHKSGTTLIVGLMGLITLLKNGPWAEVRARLVPSLKDEDLPDASDLAKEESEYQDELRIDLVEPVRADLKALEGRELEAEETKVLLMLEWCFPNLADEIQALIPLKSEPEDSGGDDETAPGEVPEPEAAQTGQETQPVEASVPSDDFTALDKLLIRAAVDSVGAVEGSLPPQEVEDLIEEVIHLNTTRTKSYFHRGYFHSLAGFGAEPGGQEQNQERRAWEWAGRVIGLARFNRSGEILKEYDQNIDLARLMSEGRFSGAALVELARLALGKRELGLAKEYLDLAEGLGLNKSDLELEHRWASDLADSQTAPVQVAHQIARQVSILLVGGNEVQARYDDAIRDHFRRVDQRLRIEFIHPAWSSNWNTDLDEVKRKLDTHHALVVMRFNRTLFGRHVRRLAGEHGKLWFPCTGHGRDSLIRAIDRAAGFLRSMPA